MRAIVYVRMFSDKGACSSRHFYEALKNEKLIMAFLIYGERNKSIRTTQTPYKILLKQTKKAMTSFHLD